MKKIIFILSIVIFSTQISFAKQYCYSDGCVEYINPWRQGVAGIPETPAQYTSATEFMKDTASRIYDFANRKSVSYSEEKDANNVIIGISCANSISIRRTTGCSNGANNPPSCNICPANLVMQNNLCVCPNGATNPTTCNICPAGSNMLNGQCTCSNGGGVFAQCNNCKTGQVYDANGQCKDGCNTTNACGQTIIGIMNAGKCELSTINGDPNASCIVDFNVTTNTVSPNGSVEFSWSLASLPKNVGSRCGFVDLTTPTPRPIPGLQNLSPETDKIRINNVQATTRFCLVCQFYSLLNNTDLGEAAKHQWVRVIKVGEN